ncbi:RPS6 [Symbiodinium natans]|uniref:RPS6 protein n=1 Tax=Symbiodinium natans TaxID=878477 RepID=A0A812S434_9DINO|nr:RPS6 [Symbiodinium natans]
MGPRSPVAPAWSLLSLLGACTVIIPSGSTTACLPDGIPATNRSYIQQDPASQAASGLDESPIRITVFDWASSELTSIMADIFVREVLGYHAVILPHRLAGSLDALPDLAGCTDEDCTGRQVRDHVAMDAWISDKIPEIMAFDARNPGLGPENLGSIGYTGEDALCVNGAVRRTAFCATGLALEFYKSYNVSIHQANQFFDRLSDLDPGDFLPCNTSGTMFRTHSQMEAYLRWTGDTAGITNASNGKLVAYCPDGYFWLSPACRHDVDKCIPTVATGSGFFVNGIMQWAAHYNMPLAIGIASQAHIYSSLAMTARTLFHCWLPDATFYQTDASFMVFPRHKASEWKEYLYRTQSGQAGIVKFVSGDLRARAPKVVEFLENFALDFSEMQELLIEVTTTPMQDVACQWIRSRRTLWESWVPVETQCLTGYGLQNSAGEHVLIREEAVGCSVCAAGEKSEEFTDELGPTHRCVPCPPGSSQSTFGESFCSPCDVGTFADKERQAYCSRCPSGHYTNKTGTTECMACGGGNQSTTSRLVVATDRQKWIQVDGATSDKFCGCVEGWYMSSQGQCTRCMSGSRCPGSSDVEVLPGFFASASEPGNIFRCFGDGSRCPGGLPGTCAEGRDAASVTCYDCLPGMQSQRDGTCGSCTGTSYLVILTAVVAVVGCIALLYGSLGVDVDRTTQAAQISMLALSLAQLLTVAQQLAVINKFGLSWDNPVDRILRSFEFMGLNLDMLAISCLARMSPVAKYGLRTSAVLILALVASVVHVVAVAINRKKTKKEDRCDLDVSRLLRTIGTLFKAFFIAIFTEMLTPFECNEHPNGLFTVQEYHSVFCNVRGEHLEMTIIGGLACLMPISFLALCTWVTWVELPKRLLRADAAYFRACAFIWSRFRPGAELYSVLYLARNGLIALVPLLPSNAAQIVAMNMILYSSLVVAALIHPWRFAAGNALDVILHVGLLVVLDMASTFAGSEADRATSIVVCVLFLFGMGLAVLGAVAYGLILHVVRGHRKPWHFFLSHQKSTSGAFARLLKIQLLKRSSRFTTFMDTDNLRDLTKLFSFVRDTNTLVFLATPGIERRKWCVGELVNAKIHGVRSVMLRWPGFQEPDERFRRNLTFAIPGIEVLASYGISLQDVSQTLTWLSTLETIPMPPTPNLERMARLCDLLTRTVAPRVEEPLFPDCIILADPDNLEAVATAYILHELLLLSVNKDMRCSLPCVLSKGQGIPGSARKALLICSTGCLLSFHLSSWLLDLAEMECMVIPIIAEPGFVVPNGFESGGDHEDERTFNYNEVVQGIFKEIATVFAPQSYSSTQEDLELRARQIAFRLQSKGSKWGSLRMSKGGDSPSAPPSEGDVTPGADFKRGSSRGTDSSENTGDAHLVVLDTERSDAAQVEEDLVSM